MKDRISIFKLWAPDDAIWAQWAKPVLFTEPMPIDDTFQMPEPTQNWAAFPDYTTAIIIDLPGAESAAEGLALAKLGYRPVPLYNGVSGMNPGVSLVDIADLVFSLQQGADELEKISIRTDAPPVFLLDANRMPAGGKQPGKFDNRWCVFPQDMPSASFLLEHGIQRVIVRMHSAAIQSDLSHILLRYQEKGIKIQICTGAGRLADVTVSQPSQFKAMMYRVRVFWGLTRNAAGGFGGMVPDPEQNRSGRRYHRIG